MVTQKKWFQWEEELEWKESYPSLLRCTSTSHTPFHLERNKPDKPEWRGWHIPSHALAAWFVICTACISTAEDLLVTSDTVAGPTTEILSKTRDSQRHPSLGYVTAHRTEEEARVRGQWAHLEASWDSNVQPPHTHTHTLVPLPHVPVAAQSWQKQQGGSGNKTCMPHSTFSVTSDPQAFPSSFWLHLHPTPFFAVHHCLGWSTYSQSSCSACSSSAGGQGGRSGLKAPTGFLWLQHGGTPGLLKELGWATTGVSKNMLLEWVFS